MSLEKKQTTRFAKAAILLSLFAVAVAGANMYRQSNSPSNTASTAEAHSKAGTRAVQPFMQGEPFSHADAASSVSLEAGPTARTPSNVAAQAYSAAERQFMLERIDHSVVNKHATTHDSDLAGASIAAY